MNDTIKVNFTVDMVHATYQVLLHVYNPIYSISYNDKVIRSIGIDLVEIFRKINEKNQRKNDLFHANKKTKITLKYYQLWALHEILIDLISLSTSKFYHLQVQLVINKLNEQL
ncbi:hypothetical protein [Tenacibaculum maritimum]|uniref:hypothetical protein n=1 Tax=Tenacibaculum maritimum TaxID=107401 RepID=UPI000466AFC2|nr:hypothetical protein [Tenacibaculum maritimum]MDB0599818.1 hypothetical protein [Tenacibaculum maritimum]MDB0610928.1 hypothetical protein [Tenacibaculum maritimum]CAA0245432.1 conserved hypothetical protein [Tenacibaculum maritimum]CAA0259967.1 conserved hypothetical protein [Tenacibaculum maritimum]